MSNVHGYWMVFLWNTLVVGAAIGMFHHTGSWWAWALLILHKKWLPDKCPECGYEISGDED